MKVELALFLDHGVLIKIFLENFQNIDERLEDLKDKTVLMFLYWRNSLSVHLVM